MDVLPTSLLCSCREIFAPLIVRLANLFFSLGTFPQDFKTAHVLPLPLLKQPGLPQSDPASYTGQFLMYPQYPKYWNG